MRVPGVRLAYTGTSHHARKPRMQTKNFRLVGASASGDAVVEFSPIDAETAHVGPAHAGTGLIAVSPTRDVTVLASFGPATVNFEGDDLEAARRAALALYESGEA